MLYLYLFYYSFTCSSLPFNKMKNGLKALLYINYSLFGVKCFKYFIPYSLYKIDKIVYDIIAIFINHKS